MCVVVVLVATHLQAPVEEGHFGLRDEGVLLSLDFEALGTRTCTSEGSVPSWEEEVDGRGEALEFALRNPRLSLRITDQVVKGLGRLGA